MQVGISKVKFLINDSFSLKDKRRINQGLISKIRRKFNVSIAEIDYQDSYKQSLIAIVTVNTDKNYLFATLSNVVKFMGKEPRIVIEDYDVEVI
jgi:uncharacterized protein YlxP (DUF503 family)